MEHVEDVSLSEVGAPFDVSFFSILAMHWSARH